MQAFFQKKPYLEKRARALKALRGFFEARGYVEVHTPVLQVCPSMDAHIHAFETALWAIDRTPIDRLYLQTSPELAMKKLLAGGMGQIYQICPVFRNAEGSRLHTAEFTMVEWYRVGVDYTYLMDEVDALLGLFDFAPCERLSVCAAFERYAGIDLARVLEDRDGFAAVAGVRVIEADGWEDIFHAVMAEKIEPRLELTILYDYPSSMAALSRKKPDDERFAERFELYMGGVEIANAFSELTDETEQRVRFTAEMDLKEKLYGVRYPADEAFFEAVGHMPNCAGIALGFDRLVMVITGANDVRDVQFTV